MANLTPTSRNEGPVDGPVGGHSDSSSASPTSSDANYRSSNGSTCNGDSVAPPLEMKNEPPEFRHLPGDFPLTYYAPEHTLPGPLPTLEEIRNAPRVSGPFCARVVFVRDYFAVKSGTHLPVNEAHALLLLERYPEVRAPRLYATWSNPATGMRHIVMQRIPGRVIDGVWAGMDDAARESVCAQLHGMLKALRSIPPPVPAVFGSVSHGPFYQRWFWSPDHDPAIGGPFTNTQDLHAALAAVASGQVDGRGAQTQWAPALWAKHFTATMSALPPRNLACTFTHSDLHTLNVMVDMGEPNTNGANNVRVTGLIDWATAGWYPAYWEFAAWFAQFSTRQEEFGGWIDKIIEPHMMEGFAIFGVSRGLEGC